jgi:hypothetical protein
MNPKDGFLESLIEWWGEQRGEQPDARTIADWLWLNSRLQGVPLPRQFAMSRGISSASELLPQRQSSSSITRPSQDDSSKPTDPADEPEPPKQHLPSFFPEQQPFAAQGVEPTARLLSPSALPEADDVKAALQRQAGVVPLLLSQAPLLPLRRLPLVLLFPTNIGASTSSSTVLGHAAPTARRLRAIGTSA